MLALWVVENCQDIVLSLRVLELRVVENCPVVILALKIPTNVERNSYL